MAEHWPKEIRLKDGGKLLAIAYEDAVFELSAEYLRVSSPSAEVRGHAPAERKTVGGKRHVGIARVEPVGNYAVKLVFDDGHDSGLYGWDYLHGLGREHDARWTAYLDELARKGLTRDAPGQR